jgi:signal transduction histidine kinase
MQARLEERLDERTRIARELHDTLLQTVHGSKLVADQALQDFNDDDQVRPAIERLSTWLARASDEARAALNSLRSTAVNANDLFDSLRNAIDECRATTGVEVSLAVTGTKRPIHAIVSDEIYRISYEAIRNACAHSRARQITVTVEYGSDFQCSVKDNGTGFDAELAVKGKVGHFGIPGMQERARQIGAALTIDTSSNTGTVVSLVVPGRIAFPKT